MASLGRKIKYFRNRAGLSQFALELGIDTSSGTISRIENDEVNPTKETIIKISKILELTHNQFSYLIDSSFNVIDSPEIKKIINKLSDKIDAHKRVCYLIDHHRCVWYFSKHLVKLMKSYDIELDKLYGHTILEIIFNPDLEVSRSMLDKE